jgi:hypothetical protein
VCACVCVSAPPLIVLLSNPTRKESSSWLWRESGLAIL